MEETDVEILHSPGSLSDSEIGILLKSQQDFHNLLREVQEKDRRIEKLKNLLTEAQTSTTKIVGFGDLFLVGIAGILAGFFFSFILVGRFSYESGEAAGLKWKQELCQMKHPKSASAYQDCLGN